MDACNYVEAPVHFGNNNLYCYVDNVFCNIKLLIEKKVEVCTKPECVLAGK